MMTIVAREGERGREGGAREKAGGGGVIYLG